MSEMPHTGEDHGDPGFVCGGNDFLVPDGATRLYNRRGACFDCGDEPVGKRKERIGRDNGSVGPQMLG